MSEFPQSREEAILQATINGDEYTDYPQSRIEELLIELKAVIESGGGGADGAWIGITTTPLTDGASTNPITIAGESVTAVAGNITSYDNEEFIFNGSVWQSFGKLSGLISRIVALEGDVGNLSNLSTETKSSLVAAVNEVVGDVSGIEAVIPEGATSSNKLATENDIPTIVANPSESASAGDLTKIQIGDNIYEIPSGGGSASGGGLTADVLYLRDSYPSQSVVGTKRTYTMAHSIDDYDAVYVLGWTYWNSASGHEMLDGRLIFKSEYYLKPTTTPTEYWTHFINGSYSNSTRHLLWIFDNNTTLKSVSDANEDGNEPILYKVYGLKFGAGVAEHISYDNTTSGLTADNVQDAIDEIAAGGGGSSDPYDGRKTRYTISSSNWSSSANASGYYTYSLTLTNALSTSTSPNVYIAGASDSTQPTATESTMFSYVKRCNLSSTTTLVLYASTKPTSTFYVFVGAEGGNDSYYVDYEFGASTLAPTQDNLAKFDAGTIGTRGAQCSISLASEYNKGYVPVSVTILTTTDSSAYIPFVMLYNANQKVVLNLYRATTSAVASAYTQVRVLFKSAQS